MNSNDPERIRLLSDLDKSVSQAVTFFSRIDEDIYDGYQTAFEVLSHLVFWHRAYCSISQALLLQKKPVLLKGSLAGLNAKAAREFAGTSMPDLATCLADYQATLRSNLEHLEDWEVNFPFKAGCRKANVAQRLAAIRKHFKLHLLRQKRAYNRGEEWIKAYYPQEMESS